MILNALCKHDISTDDHTDCLKRGGILMCPMTCTDFESRTEGIQDTVMTAIDEAYKRGYRDGQMDLRKEQEATQRYWGRKKGKWEEKMGLGKWVWFRREKENMFGISQDCDEWR